MSYKVAVLTISDKCSKGEREDESGRLIQDMINGLDWEIIRYEIVPDDTDKIIQKLLEYCDTLKADIVFTNGGTGFSPRDNTPEATTAVIEKEIPGIPEAMRFVGFQHTKRAMLSRGIAGIRGKSLIINLPGSTKGAKESLEAILEELPHGLEMLYGREHRHTRSTA